MAEAKLSAPVGQAPRTSPGPKVANNKTDVILVQEMLHANGFPTPINGKVNAGMIKAIGAAERKLAGQKTPEFVVDPGGKLFKAMVSKHNAYVQQIKKTEMVTLPSLKITVAKKDYDKFREDLLNTLSKICGVHERTYNYYHKMHLHFLEAGAMQDGVLRAVSTAVSVLWGSVKLPSLDLMRRAETAVKNLRSAIKSKDFKSIDIFMYRTERALDYYYRDLNRYLKELGRSAGQVGTALTVTTAAGWIVVGAMATPVVAAALPASLAGGSGAAVITSGGIATLQGLSREIGGYSMGTQKSIKNMAYNLAIDGVVGGVTGGLGSKLPEVFKRGAADQLGSKVAGTVSYLSLAQAKKLITDYLTHAGTEAGIEAISGAVKLIGESAKKGRTPSKKEFDAAVHDILFKVMMSGVLKGLGNFEKKVAVSNRKLLTSKVLPDRMKSIAKGTVPDNVRVKVINTVLTKTNEELAKIAFGYGLEKFKGNEKPDQLAKKGSEKMVKDPAATRIIDFALRDALRQQKCVVN